MRGLSSILSPFRSKFDKFNNTRAQMFDSVNHVTIKLLKKHILCVKMLRFCHYIHNIVMTCDKNSVTKYVLI